MCDRSSRLACTTTRAARIGENRNRSLELRSGLRCGLAKGEPSGEGKPQERIDQPPASYLLHWCTSLRWRQRIGIRRRVCSGTPGCSSTIGQPPTRESPQLESAFATFTERGVYVLYG